MSDQPYRVPSAIDESLASKSIKSAWTDWIGIIASIGCVIHCAAMPFVIAVLPTLGLSFLADESFHKWMALACFVIALVAFAPGWRKHRRLMPAIFAFAGITIITSAAYGMTGDCCVVCAEKDLSAAVCNDACCEQCVTEAAQRDTKAAATILKADMLSLPIWLIAWVTPVGAVLLVCGHLLNRWYGCRCDCCEAGNSIGSQSRSTQHAA